MKKIFIIFSIIALSLLSLHVETVFAGNATTLKVHYYRYDNDYSDWSLWMWAGESEGSRMYFTESDSYGEVATIDIASTYGDVEEVGVIVSTESWQKDIEQDRFIDLTNPDSQGVVHAYFLQGEEFISYVSEDQDGCNHGATEVNPYLCAQVLETGLIDAYFNDDYKLVFNATESVTSSDVTVYADDVQVSFSGFSSGSIGTLTINGLDLAKTYRIKIDFLDETSEMLVRVGAGFDSQIFADVYHYDGVLGPIYTKESTTLKVWAPLSSEVSVNLYTAGHPTSVRYDGADTPYEVHDLTYTGQGVWEVELLGDMHGVYYTFNVVNSGLEVKDIQDPYGQTFGLNGARSMIIDMDLVNPEGWDQDSGVDGYTNHNDAIIYELHVRDLTSDSTWNGPNEYRNTYLGLTIDNTSYTNTISNVTVSTGLAHLKELGITHLHLLPTYDQDWNDERNFQFNWGYNPQNYNSPEGGYSTDPYDGSVRVNEYKQMVMALHVSGINVINDVVYNHTGPGSYYSFNRIVPNYFYRTDSNGNFLDASGCGNETASERYMVSKFIVDSVEYWAKEYHIDGFRFDLMQIHDVDTMNALSEKVEEFDQDIFVYGEPWAAASVGLPYQDQAGKHTLEYMPLIAAFNDDFRNAIKGSPDGSGAGFVTTGFGIDDIMKGIEGSQDWQYGSNTNQTINYTTAHDNLTLYDKLLLTNNETTYTKAIDYQARLSNSITMFSQGTPFLHAGVDFLRSKGGNHNSYEAPDSVNQLDYSRKSMYVNSFEYYKGIIEIRKAYESFTMTDYNDINANLEFLYPNGYGMVGYRLTKNNEDILVYFHGGDARNIDVSLPTGAWELMVDRDQAGLNLDLGTYSDTYPIEPYETLVFVRGDQADVITSPEHEPEAPDQPIITNKLTSLDEGVPYRLNVDRAITSYSVDDGEFITISEAEFVYLFDLEVGTHKIVVQTEEGGVSDPFFITVLPVASETCEENPDQEQCDTVDPEPETPEPEEPTNDIEPEDTGCFGNIGNSLTMIGVLSLIGLSGLYVLRKK